jgi:hypothetical protein
MSTSGNYALPVTELSSTSSSPDPNLVQSGPNVGLWIGIGISIFLVVLAIIIIIVYFATRKKRAKYG